MNPLAGNPFLRRDDAQRAVLDLFAPLLPAYEAGGARVSFGVTAPTFDAPTVALESFVRPLWGVVPLAAGGAEFPHWELFRRGLSRGTDPRDPQFWGAMGDVPPASAPPPPPTAAQAAALSEAIAAAAPAPLPEESPDQRMVEMPAIGLALALTPEHIFDPLSDAEKERVLAWLEPINRYPPAPNNWQFFRVIVNLGVARVGGPVDRDAVEQALEAIDGYWLGDGWYRDGALDTTDFYNAWAFHFYGLIYATLAADRDPDRCARFRKRARRFAVDWEARSDAAGRIVPFGRSLTYRFAGAAFWGALAFAGVDALPWGQIRGLWARHLRWWAGQPIARPDGVLSIGWAYPDLLMSETYNSPGSPYWALKAFLPLALPADHPFWAAPEAETGREPRRLAQRPAVAVVNRDDQQAQLLNGGRGHWLIRQGTTKYGKFAYSSAFAFGLDPDDPQFLDLVDSILLLRDPDGVRRVRAAVVDGGVDGDVVWSRWQPFPDVEVVTVLCGEAPWHARIHHLRSGRALATVEGGFAIGAEDDPTRPGMTHETADGAARVATGRATSAIVDAGRSRRALVRELQPNTNLAWARSVMPALAGSLPAGVHALACVVAAVEAPWDLAVADLPTPPERAWTALRNLVGEDPRPALF